MILNHSDLKEFEKYIENFRKTEKDPYFWWEDGELSVDFFAERPQLILPVGFDNTKPLFSPEYSEKLIADNEEWAYELIEQSKSVRELYGIKNLSFDFEIEYLFRKSGGGAWSWFLGLENDELIFRGPNSQSDEKYSVDSLYNSLKKLVAVPDPSPRTLWLPKLWTVGSQESTRLELGKSVTSILKAIISEKTELKDIKPRTFEGLVAELLRSQGMDIHVTPQSRDGGRDIIAKGELFPGEPITLAVEVKQKSVVGIGDVDRAMRANEDYPAIMLATSGRFSAGVIQEQQRNRNNLRLLLKDGVALSQWINRYWQTKLKI